MSLLALADRLYAGPLESFTPDRDAAAKEAKGDPEGGKELAARIKKLKKPSIAAWAINNLVRNESDQIEQVFALAGSLREAAEALDGEELRALTRQRRQLTNALATTARSLAKDAGVKLTGPVIEQVEGMVNAAMLDPVAADVVRSGLVISAFTSTGLSEVDVAAVMALPDELGVRAEVAEQPKPDLKVVPEDDRVKRAKAQDALDAANAEVDTAKAALAEVESSLEKLGGRRLELDAKAEEASGARWPRSRPTWTRWTTRSRTPKGHATPRSPYSRTRSAPRRLRPRSWRRSAHSWCGNPLILSQAHSGCCLCLGNSLGESSWRKGSSARGLSSCHSL